MFVGRRFAEELEALKAQVKAVRFGETGYAYVLDGTPGKSQGTLMVHPNKEGQNLLDAKDMLEALSGRVHQVMTAVALATPDRCDVRLVTTNVAFRKLDEAEIEAYWRTGEPCDKAGAYAIQGHAAAFVAHIDGSYTGVMGLPLFETAALLRQAGYKA